MNLGSIPRRRARWAVPAGAVCAVGVVVAATTVASAHSAPNLPRRSVTQLLAGVQAAAARPPAPMTATVQETLSLGLPSLPSGAGLNNPFGAFSGTRQFGIWYASPARFRVAEQAKLGETDVRRKGSQLWLWNSSTQTATHVLLPRHASAPVPGGPGAGRPGAGGFRPLPAGPLTSPAAIRSMLAAAGRSTVIRVGQNVTVAGRPAYQLVIKPKTSKSLIGRVVIAIDAARHIPLQLQIFARGGSQPAVQIGFTSLSFGTPAASNFTFTPPPGAKVRTVSASSLLPLGMLPVGGLAGPLAAPVPVPGSQVTRHQEFTIRISGGRKLPPATLRRLAKRLLRRSLRNHPLRPGLNTWPGTPAQVPGTYESRLRALGSIQAPAVALPQVTGKGWLAVLRTPHIAALAQIMQQLHGRQAITSSYTPSGQGNTAVINSPAAGHELMLLRQLVAVATPVRGSWGSGRLLRTALVSVLFTSQGRILIGAVAPSVLYADAAG